jgi:nicotinamidase-related amidase
MAPLLEPAACSVLFIEPEERNLALLSAGSQHVIAKHIALLTRAACAACVPIHLAFTGDVPEPDQWLAAHRQLASPGLYGLGSRGSSWSGSGLDTALAAQRKASLVVCGFWLETTVTFLVLPALACGFDVFLALDVTPARAEDARGPAEHRLVQAGAVPTTAAQLVSEWIEASTDPNQRSALASVMAPTEGPPSLVTQT